MAWWWALGPRNPRSVLAAHSEADLMQGRVPQHLPALPLPDTDSSLSWSFTTSSSQWLLMIDIFTIVPFHPTPRNAIVCDGVRCKIVFCSSLSVGCSWHIMTFSLEFSWITWIPLPPRSWPRASCHRGFLAAARNEAFCHSAPASAIGIKTRNSWLQCVHCTHTHPLHPCLPPVKRGAG